SDLQFEATDNAEFGGLPRVGARARLVTGGLRPPILVVLDPGQSRRGGEMLEVQDAGRKYDLFQVDYLNRVDDMDGASELLGYSRGGPRWARAGVQGLLLAGDPAQFPLAMDRDHVALYVA